MGITKIIRAGTEHFTSREWQELVICARLAPAEPEPAAQAEPQHQQAQQVPVEQVPISLASPETQHREIAETRPIQAAEHEGAATFWSDSAGFTSELPKSQVSYQREPKL